MIDHDSIEALGLRVGESVQRFGTPNYTTHVEKAFLGKICILIAGKYGSAILSNGLVTLLTDPIIAVDRFRHLGCGFFTSSGDVLDDIFLVLQVVSHRSQGVTLNAGFVLGDTDLAMVFFSFVTPLPVITDSISE